VRCARFSCVTYGYVKYYLQEFADRLGVSQVTVNTLLQERRDLSAELAARIAKLLRHTPESWIRMQEALDLWRIA
jgi:addiction module HigA family antidote